MNVHAALSTGEILGSRHTQAGVTAQLQAVGDVSDLIPRRQRGMNTNLLRSLKVRRREAVVPFNPCCLRL